MRILTWNILHGGGAERLPEIVLSLVRQAPDIVVLTEFRLARGSQIRAVLADHGLTHQLCSHREDGNGNGLLIASRLALEPALPTSPTAAPPRCDGRWLLARVPLLEMDVLGVHVPDDTRLSAKAAFWQAIVAFARGRAGERAVVLGDFNTGRRFQDGPDPDQTGGKKDWASIHGCEALLGTLLSLGFVDAWRRLHPSRREYSWSNHDGQERRIDSVYLSPPLAQVLQAAAYSQLERRARVSDHAPLMVEISLESGPERTRTQGAQPVGLFARGE